MHHGPARRRIALALTGIALVGTTLSGTSAAALATPRAAAPQIGADGSFYDPPARITGRDGDVLRHRAARFYLDPLRTVRAPARVQRVMYHSTDRTGRAIAVTGTVLTPRSRWTGRGVRPVVGYAVGTQGLGDQCAPSRQLAAGSEYEGTFIAGLLARGYGVVVTDYQGLGTPGLHTYVSRSVQGRAVLDSVRAAQRLPQAGLPDAGPVALTGYSQGGGATAAAAELAASYAPELKVRGVVAGAVPADLAKVAANLDGSAYFAFLGYAVAGLSASYHVDTDRYLNARGREVLSTLEGQCTFESVGAFPFLRSETLTADGAPVTTLLRRQPFKRIVARQLIGRLRPRMPVLVTQSRLDDVIPYAVGLGLARRWCARGAQVRFAPNLGPTHVGGAVASYPRAFAFLEARFAGHRFASGCSAL